MKILHVALPFLLTFAGVQPLYAQATLKEAFKNQFLVGVAVNQSQFDGRNPVEEGIIKSQFNSITPENVMKWESINPKPGNYNFGPADQFVDFGLKNGMAVIGHNLIWHSQTPDWVFEDAHGQPVDRETLLTRMHDHIAKVMGRYKGKVKGWDVVNEVMGENGSLRESRWLKIIGPDYIAQAFKFAHEADPQAELYYNDYGLEHEGKRLGALKLVQDLKAAGVTITGVGIQEHVNLTWPSILDIDATIKTFGALGLKVMVTELDVDILPARPKSQAGNADINHHEAAAPELNPYTAGLPDELQLKLAQRYSNLFKVYLQNQPTVTRVTIWGVSDAGSWLNNFPIHGRTNYPLLFNRKDQAKPALQAIINVGAAK
ncbi:MAG: endo-1,4-beta-xylanase [Chthoniobacteraceae bacterium]